MALEIEATAKRRKKARAAKPRKREKAAAAAGAGVEKALRDWRLAEAKRREVPAFRILSDRALQAIAADSRPASANCWKSPAWERGWRSRMALRSSGFWSGVKGSGARVEWALLGRSFYRETLWHQPVYGETYISHTFRK